jgi:hypothetical protein
MADQLHAVCVAFIVLSILASTVALRWEGRRETAKWERPDRVCRVLFPGLFLLAVYWMS